MFDKQIVIDKLEEAEGNLASACHWHPTQDWLDELKSSVGIIDAYNMVHALDSIGEALKLLKGEKDDN